MLALTPLRVRGCLLKMQQPLFRQIAWGSTVVIVIGFFMPWAALDIRETSFEKDVSKHARSSLGKLFHVSGGGQPRWIRHRSGHLPVIPTRVSGAQIPELANRKNVKVATSLVELFTKQRQNVGPMSYAVYLLPGIAIVLAALMAWLGHRRLVAIPIALLCAGIAGVGCWTLFTTNTKAAFAIRIEWGLWASLLAYAVFALAVVASMLPEPMQQRVVQRLSFLRCVDGEKARSSTAT